MRARSLFRLTVALQAFLLTATLILPTLVVAAVSTDQADYSPGSVVTISGDNSDGAGYMPGETVDVVVMGPNGYTASCSAVADDGGAWSCQVTLWDSDLAVGAYTYTATGQASDFTETGTFTDAVNLHGVDPLDTVEGSVDHVEHVTVTVTGSNSDLTVYWRTLATGSATAGASCGGTVDYVTTSGSTSTSGTDFTVAVTICGDTTPETNETFQLEASTSATFASGNEFGTLTILNDDNSASIADVSQAEGNAGTSAMIFTVSLDNPVAAGGTIKVDYGTAGIGATSSGANCSASRDFISASGTLTFNEGETSDTISVSICGDAVAEADEMFAVYLNANTSTNTAVAIGDAQAIGTILDDDAPVSNTPPSVSVTGVSDGSSYFKGSVPVAGCSVTDLEDGASSFLATLGAIIGPDSASGVGTQTASCSYTDGGGLTASASATYTIIDGSAPIISYVLTPATPDGDNGWFLGPVTLDWTVTEADSPSTLVLSGCVDQNLTGDQVSTDYFCSATSSGGSSGPTTVSIKIDGTAPSISISHTADGLNGWNVTDPVPETIIASDVTSGIDGVDCTGVSPVTGSEPNFSADVTGEGVHDLSCTATDQAGNESAADTDQVKIDTVAPSISIASPVDGMSYILGALVSASYSCSDATSPPASCVGPVADGASIDTATIGPKSFTVDAQDQAGNTASLTADYTVKFGVCYLYDPSKAHKAGSTVPIKIYLCDVNGLDVSSSVITVKATYLTKLDDTPDGVLDDSGNADPEGNFRYDGQLGPLGGYIFNLSSKSPSPALGQTTALHSGTYKLWFTVDAVGGYSARFNIR